MKEIYIFISIYLISSSMACNIPPKFWCDNKVIAENCKVLDQCTKLWESGQATADGSASPVSLALYYEAMCPDCKDFFQQQLGKAMDQVGNLMDLSLVPFGNAREQKVGDHWEFTCQHGPHECMGNLIETCALHYFNSTTKAFPFIFCMENSDSLPEEAAKLCASRLGVSLAPIMSCVTSAEGNALEHQMAALTDKLNPPHKYVPWILLNGVHTEAIQQAAQEDLIKLICDTYQGPKPSQCNKQQKARKSMYKWNLLQKFGKGSLL